MYQGYRFKKCQELIFLSFLEVFICCLHVLCANYWDARRSTRPQLPSFSSGDEDTGSQRAVRDGFVLESNGSFESGMKSSFDQQAHPPDLTNSSSKGSGGGSGGGDGGSSSGPLDSSGSSGSGLNVMMVYPPMQLYHGLFGRALPDSTWPSDHCLVTTAIALEPEPTSSSTREPPSRMASTTSSNGD